MYAKGEVAKNEVEAEKLFRKAAELGSGAAKVALRDMGKAS